jgi:hypothetical protein
MPGRNGAGIRRSSRVALRVPLRIYEPDSNKRFLVEEASALKVSLRAGSSRSKRMCVPTSGYFWLTKLRGKLRSPRSPIWGRCS